MKKLISVFVCCAFFASLCAPVSMAIRTNDNTSLELPPGIVLHEGETWIPANGIMPIEELCDRPGHTTPSGYRYVGCVTGDSFIEGAITAGVATITGYIPGIGLITTIISVSLLIQSVIDYFNDGKQVRTTYYKYIWSNGIGSHYWYHVVWVSGSDYVTCEVSTSG